MSIQAISAVLELGPEVTGARRLVLISLANHASSDTGETWIKRKTIAEEAGLAKLDTVTQALSWLEGHGYIDRRLNAWAGSDGQIPAHKRPNVYRLRFLFEGSPSDGEGTRETGRGDPPETGSHPSPPNGYQNHHSEPSLRTPAANENVSQTPARTHRAGKEEQPQRQDPLPEPLRSTLATIVRNAGLDHQARDRLQPIVAEAMVWGTPQVIVDTAVGNLGSVRDPVKVIAHRLRKLAGGRGHLVAVH